MIMRSVRHDQFRNDSVDLLIDRPRNSTSHLAIGRKKFYLWGCAFKVREKARQMMSTRKVMAGFASKWLKKCAAGDCNTLLYSKVGSRFGVPYGLL